MVSHQELELLAGGPAADFSRRLRAFQPRRTSRFQLGARNGNPASRAMIFRCIVLLWLLAVGGCCASGVGCTTGAPSGGVAWDGLGPAPEENAVSNDIAPASSKSASKRSQQKAEHFGRDAGSGNQWEQEQAADQAADAKLRRQLKICSNCQSLQR